MARAARSDVIDRFPRHALVVFKVFEGSRTVFPKILELYYRYWISNTYLHRVWIRT
jgi:hypothetical protein